MMSDIYEATCKEVRYLGLSNSVGERLARFLLDLKPAGKGSSDAPQLKLTLTQEEIAGMIGSSRETVSRLFASFKQMKLIELHGSTLIIKNKRGLQDLVNG
jgi:CRP/FNR family transcriptional regulator